ncbi:MAG: HAD-IB family hydrolase [Robiginitomaculum sp.]|nr:HAD-IB family hydrolase [Robiginitomaculum sp.]
MAQKQQKEPVQLIAFDFDGTITTADTFALFLRYWAGTPRWIFNLLKLLPIFIAYTLKIIDRDKVKEHVVRTFFKGADEEALNRRAKQFAREVIPGLIRPKALEVLKEKNKPPYTLYIVSASINHYLDVWAIDNGISNVIATNLHAVNGRLTGELSGPNCWGQGKMAKITAEMAQTPFKIVEAYGDTRGDREMLHAAQESFFKPFRL